MRITTFFYKIIEQFAPMPEMEAVELQAEAKENYSKVTMSYKEKLSTNVNIALRNKAMEESKDKPKDWKAEKLIDITFSEMFFGKIAEHWLTRSALALAYVFTVPTIARKIKEIEQITESPDEKKNNDLDDWLEFKKYQLMKRNEI